MTRKADKRTGESVTPERKRQVAKAQEKRRNRLAQAAEIAGFATIDALANAIINGEVAVKKK